jgi:hypothetical protein
MNKAEARSILHAELLKYRAKSYPDLLYLLECQDCSEVKGPPDFSISWKSRDSGMRNLTIFFESSVRLMIADCERFSHLRRTFS